MKVSTSKLKNLSTAPANCVSTALLWLDVNQELHRTHALASSVVLVLGGVVTKIEILVMDNCLNHMFMVFNEISTGAEGTNN